MKVLVMVIVLILAVSPCAICAKDTRPLWKRIFIPLKVKPKPSKKHRVIHQKEAVTSETPEEKRSKSGMFVVDSQWWATYVEQEAAWGYWIPDDANVKFKDGKIHVPPVVYRHWQDLEEAKKRKEKRNPNRVIDDWDAFPAPR